MKRYTLLFLVLLSISGYAQNTINNYKYVIVPEKFSFLKQNDQYKLNTLTKALLQDKGFTVYFDNAELPTEIANNKCSALTADLLEKNTMFSTNLTLLLKDCYGKTVFETKQGKSREKEYTVSYNLALRDAFSSLSDTPYAYVPATAAQSQQAAAASAPVASVTAANSVPAAVPVSTNVPAAVSAAAPAKAAPAESKLAAGTLYAQPNASGYQLIDTTPKIILTLYKTSAENYFIAANSSSSGIVFKKNDSWVLEYYSNGQLITEKLLIKF
ncbi:hypothetical protein [Pedobacter westerhofensis]|nr:hypothetical protein [Pedobacter westerhofensis]